MKSAKEIDAAAPRHFLINRTGAGSGVQEMSQELVEHAKNTGHTIDSVIAEIAWRWASHEATIVDVDLERARGDHGDS